MFVTTQVETIVSSLKGEGRLLYVMDKCFDTSKITLQVKSSTVVRLGVLNKVWGEVDETKPIPVVSYYKISNVLDPNNFFVTPPTSCKWMDHMQELYNCCHHLYRIKSTRLFKNHLYACRDLTTNVWHRVRVGATRLNLETVRVRFIDTGKGADVDANDVVDLDKQFWCYPPRLMKAKLHNVFPPGETNSWPLATVVYFKELCKPGDLVCGILKSSTCLEGEIHVSLILYQQDPKVTASVQDLLVARGLAQSSNESDDYCEDDEEIPVNFFYDHI